MRVGTTSCVQEHAVIGRAGCGMLARWRVYCRPARASRTSVTASGKTRAMKART